jgi:phosphoglycerate dehydrogenase-like enzyme
MPSRRFTNYGDIERVIVMISSPIESDLVERIRAVPAVSEVLYDPGLLPKPRYPNDHIGPSDFALDPAAARRWNEMLRRATALIGYPHESPAELARALDVGRDVRFVQGTSAGMGAHVRSANLSPEILERVRFATAAGVHGGMLAEFVFYGLLSLRKDARRLAALREERSWDHYAMGELDGSAIAIVGMGQIGCAIATRARAFGMRVVAVARTDAPHALADETFATADIAAAFARVDAVAVTLPGTDATRGLVSEHALAALKPSAIFANVGRGAVVNQAALLEMLRSGRLAGAVLDVFDPEPLPPDHPFWTMENVVFAPHTAALSLRENERIVALFCENLTRLAAGEPLRNALNRAEYY